MKRFADLDDFLIGDAAPGLVLTIAGHQYAVPPPSAEVGLWCERAATAAGAVQTAATDAEVAAAAAQVEQLPELPGELTLPERLLTVPIHAAMVANGVDHVRIRIATMTTWVWIVAGEERAQAYWEAGGRPEALRPAMNRAQRRASSSTGGASTTSSPDSTSGTRSPTKSVGGKRARRSRGRRSSNGGRS